MNPHHKSLLAYRSLVASLCLLILISTVACSRYPLIFLDPEISFTTLHTNTYPNGNVTYFRVVVDTNPSTNYEGLFPPNAFDHPLRFLYNHSIRAYLQDGILPQDEGIELPVEIVEYPTNWDPVNDDNLPFSTAVFEFTVDGRDLPAGRSFLILFTTSVSVSYYTKKGMFSDTYHAEGDTEYLVEDSLLFTVP